MNIYEAVTGNIKKWIEEGVTRNGNTTHVVRLPEVIEHARIIVDHLWKADPTDGHFWAHVYVSVVTLEDWIEQQTTRPISVMRHLRTFLELQLERPNVLAFAAGLIVAVLFFLPEILGLTC